MYGLLCESLHDFIKESYGDDVWKLVRERADVRLHSFVTHEVAPKMCYYCRCKCDCHPVVWIGTFIQLEFPMAVDLGSDFSKIRCTSSFKVGGRGGSVAISFLIYIFFNLKQLESHIAVDSVFAL